MSLVATNFVPQGPIKSVDIKQFVDLFTGVMTDQPVTFKNATLLGGSQGTTTAPLKLFGVVGQTSALAEAYVSSGAASPTWGVTGIGIQSWSPGSPSAYDTNLSRIALQNGHVSDTAGIFISPRLEVPPGTFDGTALIDGSVTPPKLSTAVGGTIIREEFLPINGATQITIAQSPTGVIMVSRNGIVQSTTDGHYSTSIRVFTFSTPFDGTERVDIAYAVGPFGGGLIDQSVTNIKLASDTARANLLTNGGFEIWQRGNGPFTATSVYTADRWVQSLAAGDTLSTSANAGVAPQLPYTRTGAQLVYTRSTGGSSFAQTVRDSDHPLHGKPVSLSAVVYSTVPNAIRLNLNDGTNNTYSAYHPGDSTWKTLTVTGPSVPLSATSVVAGFVLDASGTFYVDNAMLVVGSVPADYMPLHPADDLARCLRYYQRWQPASGAYYVAQGSAQTTTAHYFLMAVKAALAATPTLTVSAAADWQVINESLGAATPCISFAASGLNKDTSVLLQIGSAAIGTMGTPKFLVTVNANAWLALEGNP